MRWWQGCYFRQGCQGIPPGEGMFAPGSEGNVGTEAGIQQGGSWVALGISIHHPSDCPDVWTNWLFPKNGPVIEYFAYNLYGGNGVLAGNGVPARSDPWGWACSEFKESSPGQRGWAGRAMNSALCCFQEKLCYLTMRINRNDCQSLNLCVCIGCVCVVCVYV